MANDLINAAWASTVESPAEMVVLVYLADAVREGMRHCFPGIDTIARDTRLSRRGVQGIIARLEAAGHITKHARTGRENQHLFYPHPKVPPKPQTVNPLHPLLPDSTPETGHAVHPLDAVKGAPGTVKGAPGTVKGAPGTVKGAPGAPEPVEPVEPSEPPARKRAHTHARSPRLENPEIPAELPAAVRSSLEQWLKFKRADRNEGYTEIGWRNFCSMVLKFEAEVIELAISEAIQRGWQGPFFARHQAEHLKKNKGGGSQVIGGMGMDLPAASAAPEPKGDWRGVYGELYGDLPLPWGQIPPDNQSEIQRELAKKEKGGRE